MSDKTKLNLCLFLFIFNLIIINFFLADCGFIIIFIFSLIALVFICIKLNFLLKECFTLSSLNKKTSLIMNRALVWEVPQITVLNSNYKVAENTSFNYYISLFLILFKVCAWLVISYYLKVDYLFINYVKNILAYSIILDLIVVLLLKKLPIFYILLWFLSIFLTTIFFFKLVDMPLILSNNLGIFIQKFYTSNPVQVTEGLPVLLTQLSLERDEALLVIASQNEIIHALNQAVSRGNDALFLKHQGLNTVLPTSNVIQKVTGGVLSFFSDHSWIITGGVIVAISVISFKTLTMITGEMPGMLKNKILESTGLSRFVSSNPAPVDAEALKKTIEASLNESVTASVTKTIQKNLDKALELADIARDARITDIEKASAAFETATTQLFAAQTLKLNTQLADFIVSNTEVIKHSIETGGAVVVGLQITNSILSGRIAGIETLIKGMKPEARTLKETLPSMQDLLFMKDALENKVSALTLRVSEINSMVNELNALLIHTLKAIPDAGAAVVAPAIPAATQVLDVISSML